MAGLPLNDLRSYVVRGSTDCSFLLSIEVQLGRQPKVSKLDLHLAVDEEIAKFEISMDHSMRMQVLKSIDDLGHPALDLNFMKSFSSTQQLIESLVLTDFQNDIYIL